MGKLLALIATIAITTTLAAVTIKNESDITLFPRWAKKDGPLRWAQELRPGNSQFLLCPTVLQFYKSKSDTESLVDGTFLLKHCAYSEDTNYSLVIFKTKDGRYGVKQD